MASAYNGLRYTESGSGAPVVLLDWTPWETSALADALAARYKVISIAPPPTFVQARDSYAGAAPNIAEAVAEVAADAGLNSYAVVGVSLGADAAFRLALLHPDAVASLVLVSPTCISPAEPPVFVQERGDTPAQLAASMLAHPEDAPNPPDPGRTAALAQLWRDPDGDDATALLPELLCATLAVFGQEDRLVSREAGGVWKERAPNCNVCYVYDAGHAVGVDRPDALAGLILDFVERRETFIVENRSSLINP